MRIVLTLMLLIGLFAGPAPAQDERRPPAAAEVDHPIVPADASPWAGTMVIIILAIFLMAAVVGPIVRAEMPEAGPVSHGHHEPVGHEHGHHVEHGH